MPVVVIEKTMMEKCLGEIISAAKGESAAVKEKKEDTHKMATGLTRRSHTLDSKKLDYTDYRMITPII